MADQKSETRKRRIILLVAFAVMIAGAWYFTRLAAGYDGEIATWVHIPRHATVGEAKDSLRAALGDRFGSTVAMLWSQDIGKSHGAYRVEPGERAWRVARRISQGNQTPIKLTFNNLRTFGQLAETLAAKMDFTTPEFIEAARRLEAADGLTDREFEAQFLPDTYEVYWSASPDELIRKIRANYASFWSQERRDKAAAQGLTPLQASVLASIVEEESNRRDERPQIARLYLNRLHRGMKLQADPTVKFAAGDFAARRVAGAMLQTDSPYNTYRYAGLPPESSDSPRPAPSIRSSTPPTTATSTCAPAPTAPATTTSPPATPTISPTPSASARPPTTTNPELLRIFGEGVS